MCFSGARQDSDPPSILSLLSWSSRRGALSQKPKCQCLAISPRLHERRFPCQTLCRRESPLSLGLHLFVKCKFKKPSSDEEALYKYSSVRSANLLIFDHTLLNILSVNFLSIFGTCYIITFCSTTCGYQFLHSIALFLMRKTKYIYQFQSVYSLSCVEQCETLKSKLVNSDSATG